MSWDPQQYLKFGGERVRPAQDLLARVAVDTPAEVVDLGCGAGNVTAMLRSRWPAAHITGVDSSDAMLERARAAVPAVEWTRADIARWKPVRPADVIYSNAALQWLDDHHTLFPHLLAQLAGGGVLAVQMPAQHDAPSHRIGYDLARSPRWKDALAAHVRRPILSAEAYYSLLRPLAASVDLWFTEYVQALAGDNPVAEFTKGSFIGAWLAVLSPPDALAFESEYRASIARAYPPRADGVTLFPFRRFFIVARR